MTSTSRTARCGPACRVVWQGRSFIAAPYADQEDFQRQAGDRCVGVGLVCERKTGDRTFRAALENACVALHCVWAHDQTHTRFRAESVNQFMSSRLQLIAMRCQRLHGKGIRRQLEQTDNPWTSQRRHLGVAGRKNLVIPHGVGLLACGTYGDHMNRLWRKGSLWNTLTPSGCDRNQSD
jgi:hypothetical protein